MLFVDDGDVLTSAGVAAGIDLCLHIVRRDHGAAVANDVARRTVVPPHRDGGQAQFVRRPVPEAQSAGTAGARAWALGRLHEPIRLRDMAARESMSVRTFTRRFREEVGVSPGQWLTRQRVEHARRLLESSGPVHRPGRPGRRVRHRPVDAPASPGDARRHPDRLPAHLPVGCRR